MTRCIYITVESTPANTVSCIETDVSYSSMHDNDNNTTFGHLIDSAPSTMNPAVVGTQSSNTTSPNDLPVNQSATIHLAVVGAQLSGFPLNSDLINLNATLHSTTKTSPSYKIYALANTSPPKPGLVRVSRNQSQEGHPIEVEIYTLPLANLGFFLCTIPSPLGLGSIELEDGSWVKGFICEPYGLEGARDVSEFGGWRGYRASLG